MGVVDYVIGALPPLRYIIIATFLGASEHTRGTAGSVGLHVNQVFWCKAHTMSCEKDKELPSHFTHAGRLYWRESITACCSALWGREARKKIWMKSTGTW